jgi:molybdopterin-containing oxidoreductase family membrane subunit
MERKGLYISWLSVLGMFMIAGLYIVFRIFTQGQGVLFHSSNDLPWTLLIASYLFFILTSTGVTFIVALPSVFGVSKYHPIVKRAIFIALSCLVAGFISMGMELGSPLNMYNYVITPNFSSPIWWMGLFYASLLVLLGYEFYMLHFGRENKLMKYVPIAAFILEIAAISTLGAVFGLIEARPTFFGEYIQLYFLFSSLISGLAALIFFNIVYYKVQRIAVPDEMKSILSDFGKILGVLLGVLLLFTIWRSVTSLYSNRFEFNSIKFLINSRPYRIEILMGILVPLFILMRKKLATNHNILLLVSLFVLLGMGIGRMDLVMAGQLLPLISESMPDRAIMSYIPTIWEWIAGLFSFAFMLLCITLGEKYLNLENKE